MQIHKIKKIDNVTFEQAMFVQSLHEYFQYCDSILHDELEDVKYPTVYEYTGKRINMVEKNTLDIYRDYLNENNLDSYIEDVNYILQNTEVPEIYKASTRFENNISLLDVDKLSDKLLLKQILSDNSYYYFFKFKK